jgi:hypothetical protein
MRRRDGAEHVAPQPHDLHSGGLYVPGRVGVAAVVGCGILLAAIKAALATAGLGRTLTAIEKITDKRPSPGRSEQFTVDKAAQAVAMAAALYPGRALCLEQSLTLYLGLRWSGVPVALRFGVQPHPFVAHAWLEHCGEPIHEDEEHLRCFLPLPQYAR